MYVKYFKRLLDFTLSFFSLILLLPLMLTIAILIKIKIGSPVIFKQSRPGKNEKIFILYKFRTMTNECNEYGELLPDEIRLTRFGKWLRRTSIDELPELYCILKNTMSFVGPRPQLIKDLIFMNEEQRKRHLVKPGLTGLAQINGRNAISWEDKFHYDLEYIKKITFITDMKITMQTFLKVFKQADINADGFETSEDFGDYLLRKGYIDQNTFERRITKEKEISRL